MWAGHMLVNGQLEPTLSSSGWVGLALSMMSYTGWYILTGVTTLDSMALQQTWVWHKRIDLRELAYAKLIRVPGFDWLIAPRLYTKTASNKLTVFYASSKPMLAELKKIESALQVQQRGDRA